MFKSLVWDSLVKVAIARLFVAVPFLAWGPIGFVVSWIVMKFADALYEETELTVNLELIYLRNEDHRKEYDSACLELKRIGQTQGKDSPEWKEAYEKQKKALAEFARWDALRGK